MAGLDLLSFASSPVAASNPFAAVGMTILSGMMQPDMSQSGAGGASFSGQALFGGENDLTIKKPLLDFSNPVKVAVIVAALLGGMYLYKKHRG